jgi:sugar lactone lactonase YvrE
VFSFAAVAFSTAVLVPSVVIAAGNSPLLVVDSLNNRVVLFRLPFHNAQAASMELGQPNFKSALQGAGQNLLGGEPVGAILDKHGAIWVTDENNNRVLRFSPPFRNGKRASLVIGQPDFSSSSPNLSPNGLNVPTYVTFDSNGDLWLSDRNNCRALEYRPPFTNGMDATVVLGEPDLNAANCSVNQNGMNQTEGLTFDQQGNLWVTDRGANRVLEFTPPFSNGMPATTVIGQAILAQSGLRPTITDSTIPTASRS